MESSSADEEKLQVLLGGDKHDDETCVTFVLKEEDHTLGNAVKDVLNNYNEVEFCGYSIIHPLEDKLMIRIQTKPGVSAVDMFRKALKEVDFIFGHIEKTFQKSMSDFNSRDQQMET